MMKEVGDQWVKDKQSIPEPPLNLSGVLEPIPEPPLNLSGVLEPIPEPPLNLSGVLEGLALSQGLLERFASAMAQNILHLFPPDLHHHHHHQGRGEEENLFLSLEDDEDPPDQEEGGEKEDPSVEVLAGLMASATIAAALREASFDGSHQPNPGDSHVPMDIQGWNPPLLSQLECTAAESLDYPDAPPTTPIVPDLEPEGGSQGSFSWRLKDGLAREFLPPLSPPPPTPKNPRSEACVLENGGRQTGGDDHHGSLSVGDPHGEELSSGITTDGYRGGGGEEGPHCQQWGRAKMAAYTEELTAEIMDWVTSQFAEKMMGRSQRRSTEEGDDIEGDLHHMADRLAHSIVTSSLCEVMLE